MMARPIGVPVARMTGHDARTTPVREVPADAEALAMSTSYARYPIADLRHDLNALRGNWLWFVLLGVALIVLGFWGLYNRITERVAERRSRDYVPTLQTML
jgi:hypothetical protein